MVGGEVNPTASNRQSAHSESDHLDWYVDAYYGRHSAPRREASRGPASFDEDPLGNL